MKLPGMRFTVRRMMVMVALVGVLLSAWIFRRENRSVEQILTRIQLQSLGQSNSVQRRIAAENLSNVEPDDLPRAVPALAAAAGDDDWQVRLAAVESLGSALRKSTKARYESVGDEIKLATGALVRTLTDPRTEVRRKAAESLRMLRDIVMKPPAKPDGNTDTEMVRAVLGQAVPALIRLMNDTAPEVRIEAIKAFALIAPLFGERPDSIYGAMLNDPAPKVRAEAVSALVSGWPGPELYGWLLHRLKGDLSREERSAIGRSLGSLPPPPLELIPVLCDALTDADYALRRSIPTALAKLGPLARPALPALAKAAARELADPDFWTLDASASIATIDKDSAEAQALLEPMAALLKDTPKPLLRHRAEWVLGLYGPSAAAVVPTLRKALGSEVADVRQRAAHVLGTIGPAARAALPDLSARAAEEKDPSARRTAMEAMKRIDAK